MQEFVHLHVHSHYSLLDGQASIPRLVDKAMADGMRGIALTDHGAMFGIKEFFNYTNKKNGKVRDAIKALKKQIAAAEEGDEAAQATLPELKEQLAAEERKLFKPIFGCEMYVARNGMDSKVEKSDQSGYHLVVLAKNLTGYRNLIKLVSNAWTRGFYMRPRTERAELEKYSEGLIISTACLGGEVPKKITMGRLDEAREAIQWYKRVFGDDFYLEMQRHKATVPNANHEAYPLQVEVNEKLMEFSREFGVKLIATNDVHFADEENAEAHERLLCISTQKKMTDPNRMLYTKQEWLKTTAEMNAVFSDVPEALANTVEILDKVEFYSIDHGPIMPTFSIPEDFGTEESYRERYSHEDLYNEFTQDERGNVVISREEGEKKIQQLGGYDKLYRIKLEADYLAKLAYEGAHQKYGEVLSPDTEERINFELHIMKTMGFPGYFLIVQDFINVGREQLGVSVGPGRGSAAGSAVAYCLGITLIDPIKYDLLFERFLNPDRISLPDIDVDFDDDGRGRVLEWVTQKYGEEKVAHIITYGTMATKSALKDVARVQGVELADANRLAKLIPDKIPDKKVNLANAIAYVPELQAAEVSPNPNIRDTIKYAKMLEGNVRGRGVHACGIIICRDDITEWVPVATAVDPETGENMLVTQYEGAVIEDTGLIKMDFLGLKTLSIIKDAVANIKLNTGVAIDIEAIDINDPKTYELYSKGQTVGTFQFESAGMQKYLRELQPSTFEDLIAMNALYRPGPMEYIPDFIDRKHGRKPIEYDIPIMEKYLKDTYGITVYQEQVMLLSRLLANFTRGESDALRKAMGKKLKDKLDQLKPKFLEGGQKNGHAADKLEKIWADWEKFASYAFNKSHATCYSWVAYQTAYLKAHYPAEYMAATLSRSMKNSTDLKKFMDEARAIGINVLGPDINESQSVFSASKSGDIRFGLAGISGVGESAVKGIIKERDESGAFQGIFDFVKRVNLSSCNRNIIESLAIAGAFDSFKEIKREDFFAKNSKGESFSEVLIRFGSKYQAEQSMAVNSLFGGESAIDISLPEIIRAEEWNSIERLNKERDVVGLYLSAHPLDDYAVIVEKVCTTRMEDLQGDLTALQDQSITMAGIVTEAKEAISKRGNTYGRVKVEDYSGSYEFVFFDKDWVDKRYYFEEGRALFLSGKCQKRRYGDELEIAIHKVELLSSVKDDLIKGIRLTFPLSNLTMPFVLNLQEYVEANAGSSAIEVIVYDEEKHFHLNLASSKKVSLNKHFLDMVEEQEGVEYKIY